MSVLLFELLWSTSWNGLSFKFNFFKFLFPDAADKLAEAFESRASTSSGSNPPPENEDYVSYTNWHLT